jgi:hypothetical protein
MRVVIESVLPVCPAIFAAPARGFLVYCRMDNSRTPRRATRSLFHYNEYILNTLFAHKVAALFFNFAPLLLHGILLNIL